MNNDLISRSALLVDFGDFKDMDCPSGHVVTADYMIELTENAPAVDAEPVRHGKWSPEFINGYDGIHPTYCCECSVCKKEVRNSTYFNYCPNCGCKMDAEVEG